MRIHILGCSGSQTTGSGTTSILVDDTLLVDAGTAAVDVPHSTRLGLSGVVLTHAHLDHVCGLAFLLDSRHARDGRTLPLAASPSTIEALRDHLFNDLIWPDLTRLPTPARPAITYVSLPPCEPHSLCGYTVTAVPVDHSIPTVGLILSDGRSAVAFSSDTGPTEKFWEAVGGDPSVRALIVECSFPNEMEREAVATDHLTPRMLGRELAKCTRPGMEVYVTHLKPPYRERIARELMELSLKTGMELTLLRDGMTIDV